MWSILQSCLDKRRPNTCDIYPWYGYIMLEKIAVADECNDVVLYRLARAIRVQWFIDRTTDDHLQGAVNNLRNMSFDTVSSQNLAPASNPARNNTGPMPGLSRSNAFRSRTFPIERRRRYQSESSVEGGQSSSAYIGRDQNSPSRSDTYASPLHDTRSRSPTDSVCSASVNDFEPMPSRSEAQEYDYENYELNPLEVVAFERPSPSLSEYPTFEGQQSLTHHTRLSGYVSPLSSYASTHSVSPLSNSARADSDVLGYLSDR